MNVLFFLVPLALLLAGAAVAGFIWAVRHGQYDDVHTPAIRMLLDDDEVRNDDMRNHNMRNEATDPETHESAGRAERDL